MNIKTYTDALTSLITSGQKPQLHKLSLLTLDILPDSIFMFRNIRLTTSKSSSLYTNYVLSKTNCSSK